MTKVYLFLANGFETIEALTVVDMLRRAGKKIVTVSIHNSKTVESAQGIKVEADATFDSLDFSDACMLVLPGGMPGTKNLDAHQGLSDLIQQALEHDIQLAAICAAPSILGRRGILEGKKAICYPGFEEELKGACIVNEPVVTDGKIITSKGMGTAIAFSQAILTALGEDAMAKELGNSIQFSQFYE